MSGLVFCCGKNTLAKVVFLRGGWTAPQLGWAHSLPLLPLYNHRSGSLHSPRVSLEKPAHNTRSEQRPDLLVLTFPIIVLNRINSVGGHTTVTTALLPLQSCRRPTGSVSACRLESAAYSVRHYQGITLNAVRPLPAARQQHTTPSAG